MRISVIGAGYVGLVTGVCLAEMGHSVICIDLIQDRVDTINRGESPIFEEGLPDLLRRNLANGRFQASGDVSSVVETDTTFICVGTPSMEDGSLNLTHVEGAVRDVAGIIGRKDDYHLVVMKSTVMPSTTQRIVMPLLQSNSGKMVGEDIGLAVNPEFLREGTAVGDFMRPDRVVIGALDDRSAAPLLTIFGDMGCPMMVVSLSAAEMIKVASNAFLATKISFINEIGNLSKELGIDVREVAEGMGYDQRISPLFLRAGCGFGGSCFPKDVRGLAAEARRHDIDPIMLDAVLRVNDNQPLRFMDLLERRMSVEGKRIAVLGLAFKPGTDDVRESRAIPLVRALMEKGATVLLHDPQASENFRVLFPGLTYCQSLEDCVAESDAVMIVTEWPQYSNPDIFGDKIVIDGRGVARTDDYEGICW